MKICTLIISSLLLAACAMGEYARNPDEYITAFTHSDNALVNSFKKTQQVTIKRPPETVLRHLESLAQQCIQGKVVRSRLQEGVLTSSSDVLFNSVVETTPSGRQVMSVAVKDLSDSIPGTPVQGLYMVVAEVNSITEGTSLTFYYAPGAPYQNIVSAAKSWGASGTGTCPQLI